MLTITNPKVASFAPTWSRFVGFSILFDNPGQSLESNAGFETIRCDVTASDDLALYRELSIAIRELGEGSLSDLGLCLLPPSSYHVTFFDCGNQANAVAANPNSQASLMSLIEGLPDLWTEHHELVAPAVQAANALTTSFPVSFRYSHLKNWGNSVLVAVLEPSDEISASNLKHLVEERANLSNFYRTTHAFGSGSSYTPHVSLAYFAHQEAGENELEKNDDWDLLLRERTMDLNVRFDSLSAYAFTDMATFFRHQGC